ncbi:hypothetical protein [Jatrophihabitans endophyticus]|uniref:hypothetical protein n=1 Tax=Jatrophihabitans endophyticus TaxID=1206085 RepID=UPI0019EC9014|nr:hypothetical protein [Jatrophihabitans endophyticus]MBE7190509.1 hypothetical protein [Jatrophihabitans endophyticus]
MSGPVVLAAGLVLAVLLVWAFESLPARLVGAVLVIDGIGGFLVHGTTGSTGRFLAEMGGGMLVWMAGHWLYAAKYKIWRSTLGRAPWRLPILSALTPIPSR